MQTNHIFHPKCTSRKHVLRGLHLEDILLNLWILSNLQQLVINPLLVKWDLDDWYYFWKLDHLKWLFIILILPFLIVSEYHLFKRFLQRTNYFGTKLWNFDLFHSHWYIFMYFIYWHGEQMCIFSICHSSWHLTWIRLLKANCCLKYTRCLFNIINTLVNFY